MLNYLCHMLHDDLGRTKLCNQVLCEQLVVSVSMCVLATGIFQTTHSAVSHHLDLFITALCNVLENKLNSQYPSRLGGDNAGFYQIVHLPRIVSAIDWTHVAIRAPAGVEETAFKNRKDNYLRRVAFSISWHSFGEGGLTMRTSGISPDSAFESGKLITQNACIPTGSTYTIITLKTHKHNNALSIQETVHIP